MIDRNVEFPNRFRMTKVEGTDDIYDLIPAPGEVIAPGDTFSKANMLPDSIPAALGLKMGNPQVKDALNVLANIGNVHVWQRVKTYAEPVPEVPAGYTLGAVEENVSITNTTSSTDTIVMYSATSLTVSNDGTISTSGFGSASGKVTSVIDQMYGKFIYFRAQDSDFDSDNIIFIPSDAMRSWGDNGEVVVSKLQRVTGYPYTPAIPAGTHVDYLTSTDPNAYTEGTVDRTTITYLGQLGEPGARIEVGSYVGTGTYGTLNRCSLTFSSTPKIVFIKASNDARTMMLFYGHTRGDSTESTSNKPFTTWDGNTVTWYADVSAYLQFNSSGETYNYLAFY